MEIQRHSRRAAAFRQPYIKLQNIHVPTFTRAFSPHHQRMVRILSSTTLPAANRDVVTDSNIAKQDDIRPQLNAVTDHRTSCAVRAAIANAGDAVANGKIVAVAT